LSLTKQSKACFLILSIYHANLDFSKTEESQGYACYLFTCTEDARWFQMVAILLIK
jgi:hypothetical protein